MKVNSINLNKPYNLISFKKDQAKETVNYQKSFPTTIPADTTQFKSKIKPDNSPFTKFAKFFNNFFAEPKYTPSMEELFERSPYIL